MCSDGKENVQKRGCTCKVVRNINHIIRFWRSRNRRRRRILNGFQYYSRKGKCVEAPWPQSGGLLWGNSAINSIDRKQQKKVAYSGRELDWQHQWYASVGWRGKGVFEPWHLIQGVSVKRGPDTCGWRMRMGKCGWKKMRITKKVRRKKREIRMAKKKN